MTIKSFAPIRAFLHMIY